MRILNKILDLSIYFHFDASGFERHKREYFLNDINLEDKSILITGGTSGIGKACAELCLNYGAQAIVTGRDEEKGKKSVETKDRLHFMKLDLIEWDEFTQFAEKIERPLDGIVLNAGGMPESFAKNRYGVETQMASQLFGHYFLLKTLIKLKKIKDGARVVWVSSGGMYLTKLHKDNIFKNNEYNKVATYANVKKAQVNLLDEFSAEFSKYNISGMHPGWVDTPGLRSSIGGFFKKMERRLRKPEQGADTIVWLLGSKNKPKSGGFYFDRKVVSKNLFFNRPPKEMILSFKEILDKFYNNIKA